MTLPLAVFTEPRPQYDYDNEAQFRREIVRQFQELQQFVAAADVTGTPTTLGAGDNDDYALGDDTSILRLTPHASDSTLTGMAAPKGERRITIINIGTTNLTLSNEDAGSSANNRFKIPNGDLVMGADKQAFAVYDPTTLRWRVNSETKFTGCTAYRTTSNFSLAQGVATPIEWNGEAFDTDTFHDNSTNPSYFTVPSTGKYRVHWGFSVVHSGGSGGASVLARLRVDGNTFSYGWYEASGAANDLSYPFGGACDLDLTASSYVEMYVTATATSSSPYVRIGGWMGVQYIG